MTSAKTASGKLGELYGDPESEAGSHETLSAADVTHRKPLGYTAFENRSLDLTRLIFNMHRSSGQSAWFAAMDLAESAEGPFEGPYLVARITAFVRATLIERDRRYAYMKAGCLYVTPDEIGLMRVLRLARTGPFAEFKAAAQSLAGRDNVCRIVAAATSLAQPGAIRSAASNRACRFEDESAPADATMLLH